MKEASECLKFIRSVAPKRLETLSAFKVAQVLSRCDVAVVQGLVDSPKNATIDARRAALVAQFAPVLRKALSVIGVKGTEVMGLPSVLKLTDLEEPEQPDIGGDGQILPKIIKFDSNGNPTNQQVEILVEDQQTVELIPFAEWCQLEAVKSRLVLAKARTAALSCMATICPTAMQMIQDLVKLERVSGSIRAVATEAILEGKLLLPVMTSDIGKVLAAKVNPDGIHPHAVDVKYIVYGPGGVATETVELKVNPDSKLPKQADDTSKPLVWEAGSAPWLFWLLKRTHEEDKWNCTLVPVQMQHITVASFGPVAEFQDHQNRGLTASVWVPVMTNTRKIAKGEELMLKWARPPTPVPKPKKRTWQTDAAGDQAKKAKGGASSSQSTR